jgi:hypothetical protein
MSYGCVVFTVVIRVVDKDLGREASAPLVLAREVEEVGVLALLP